MAAGPHRRDVASAVVTRPVGLVDLAPTFCGIAGVDAPAWMQGKPLPTDDADARRPGLRRRCSLSGTASCSGSAVHLRSVFRDGLLCTSYGPGTVHDGSEGELYDTIEDPTQTTNRWADPAWSGRRDNLLGELGTHRPPAHQPRLRLEAPV